MKLFKPSRGFTLLELIVVIVIMGILASMIIPTFARNIQKTREHTTLTTLSALARETQALHAFDEGVFTTTQVETAIKETPAALAGLWADGVMTPVEHSTKTVPGAGEVIYLINPDSVAYSMRAGSNVCALLFDASKILAQGCVTGAGDPVKDITDNPTKWNDGTATGGSGNGNGETNSGGDNDVLLAPTHLAYTLSGTTLRLTWSPALGASGYKITGAVSESTASTSYSMTVEMGASYTFNVQSISGSNLSIPAKLTVVVPPSIPTDLVASTTATTSDVTWTAPAGATGYYIFVDGTQVKIVSSTSASVDVTGKPNATIGVQAYNTGGVSEVAYVSVSTIPSPPTGITYNTTLATHGASVTFAWTPSVGATSYQSTLDGISGALAIDPRLTIPGVREGTHTFAIKACNSVGCSAPNSLIINVGAYVPAPVSDLKAVGGENVIDLSWTAPAADGGSKVTEYLVTATPGGFTTVTSGTSLQITNLSQGSYTVSVVAKNSAGSSEASTVFASVTERGAPLTPTGFTAQTRAGYVALSWNYATSTADRPLTGYYVYRDGVKIGTLPLNSTSTADLNAAVGVSYQYQVSAYGTKGESAKTSPVSAAADTSPIVVNGGFEDGLNGWTFSGHVVTAAASASTGTKGVMVGFQYPYSDNNLIGSASLSQTFTVPDSGATLYVDGTWGAYSNPASYNANVQSTLTDNFNGTSRSNVLSTSGLSLSAEAGHSVTLTISAYRGRSIDYAYASLDNIRVVPTTSSIAVPTAPSGIAATVGDSSMTVSWSRTLSGPLTGYRVYLNGVRYAEVPASPAASYSAAITGLTNGTDYQVNVSAYGIGGESSAAPLSGLQRPIAPPVAPASLTATPQYGYNALSWSAVASTTAAPFTGYRVYRDGVPILTTTDLTLNDFGATSPSSVYTVASYGPGGTGPQSVSATTSNLLSVITNGGFENGLTGWTQSGNITPSLKPINSVAGGQGANTILVGFDSGYSDNSATGYAKLTQTFTLPANASKLLFDGSVFKSNYGNDTSSVSALMTDNVTKANVALTPGAAGTDIHASAGHSVTIVFYAFRGRSGPDYAYVRADNIRIALS